MALTPEQWSALKADMAKNPVMNALEHTTENAAMIAAMYALPAQPDFWVWRTSLTKAEIVSSTSVDGTTWNYTIYIARSQGERDCWGDMFSDRAGVNPSLPNVRQGWADIFSGGPGTAQRTHLLAMARRLANRGEKIYATPQSPASTSSPSTLTFEGTFSYDDVLNAWQLP